MTTKKIKGKIIRIIDTRTVIINLGEEQGINSDSIFYILGEPEEIKDPFTKEVLGTVNVTKSRVKASQVFDKFTIATTSWTNPYSILTSSFFTQTSTNDEGELNVKSSEIQPWQARSKYPVLIGDEVEVKINMEERKLTQDNLEETEE